MNAITKSKYIFNCQQRGFSLLELLLSAGMMVIFLSAVMNAFGKHLKIVSLTEQYILKTRNFSSPESNTAPKCSVSKVQKTGLIVYKCSTKIAPNPLSRKETTYVRTFLFFS
jgi:hypothetical protein